MRTSLVIWLRKASSTPAFVLKKSMQFWLVMGISAIPILILCVCVCVCV